MKFTNLSPVFFITTIFVLTGTASSEKSISVTATDRSHPLGALYNSLTQEFHETWAIKGVIPQSCIRKFPQVEISYKSSVITSQMDLLSTRGFDVQATLSIMSGMVKGGAKAQYRDDIQTNSLVVTAVTMASVPTTEEKLDINCEDLGPQIISKVLNETTANYFVSSVIFGFRYEVIFQAEAKTVSTNTDVKAALSAYVSKLTASFEAEMSGGISHLQERKDVNVTYVVKGYADLPEEELSSYSSLVTYVKKINQKIKTEKAIQKGTALYYVQTPIQELFRRANLSRQPTTVLEISDTAAKRALFLMEQADGVYQDAQELGQYLRLYSSCMPSDHFKQLSMDILRHRLSFEEFRRNITVAILKERNGTTGALDVAIKNYEENENSTKNFEFHMQENYSSHMNSLKTLRSFLLLNVNCLPVEVDLRDIPIRFHNAMFILLQYNTNSVPYYGQKWATAVNEMKELCLAYNGLHVRPVTCYQIDCAFNSKVCTNDTNPLIRVAHKGAFVDLKNQTVADFVIQNALSVNVNEKLQSALENCLNNSCFSFC